MPEQRKDAVATYREGENRLEGECQELKTGHDKFEISSRQLRGGSLWPAGYRRLEFRSETPTEVIHLEVTEPYQSGSQQKITACAN